MIIESWGYTSDRLSFHWDELLSDVKNGILNQQFVELIYKKSSTTEYSTGEDISWGWGAIIRDAYKFLFQDHFPV